MKTRELNLIDNSRGEVCTRTVTIHAPMNADEPNGPQSVSSRQGVRSILNGNRLIDVYPIARTWEVK